MSEEDQAFETGHHYKTAEPHEEKEMLDAQRQEEREIQWIADRESERISSMLTKDKRISDHEMSKIAAKAAGYDILQEALQMILASTDEIETADYASKALQQARDL